MATTNEAQKIESSEVQDYDNHVFGYHEKKRTQTFGFESGPGF